PRQARALADAAIGNHGPTRDALGAVQGPQVVEALESTVVVAVIPHGMLLAPGMCPPRWHVSGNPGGERISPLNSCGLRTSTSAADLAFTACWTSGRNARSERSGPPAL